MCKRSGLVVFIVFTLCLLTACRSDVPALPSPTSDGPLAADLSPTATQLPAPSATATVMATASATAKAAATLEPSATFTPIPPTPTPTITPPPSGAQAFSPLTAGQIQSLAVFGKGRISSSASAAAGATWVVQTPLGLYLYRAEPLEQMAFLPGMDQYWLSPDRRLLLAAISGQPRLQAFDSASGQLLVTLEHPVDLPRYQPKGFSRKAFLSVSSVGFAGDGRQMAVSYGDSQMGIYQVEGWSQVALFSHKLSLPAQKLVFSQDGKYLAAQAGETILLWRTADGQLLTRRPQMGSISANPFSPNGAMFVTSILNYIRVWSFPALDFKQAYSRSGFSDVVFTDDAKFLVVDGIEVRYLEDGSRLRPDLEEKQLRQQAVLYPIAAAGDAPVLDASALENAGHYSNLHGVRYNAPDSLLVWGVTHTPAVYWRDLFTNRAGFTALEQPTPAQARLSPDGQFLAVCQARNMYLVQVPDNTRLEFSNCRNNDVIEFLLAQDSLARSNTVQIDTFGLAGGKLEHSLMGHTLLVTALAASPDGQYLASATDITPAGGQIYLWKLDPYSLWQRWQINAKVDAPVNVLAWSPDSRYLAAGGADDLLKLFRVKDGWELKYLAVNAAATAAIFSPDGSLLIAGDARGTLTLWSVPDGKVAAELNGHSGAIRGLAFSPDGQTLASTADDGTVRLWGIP